MKENESENPPFLKSWKNVYILVIGVEIIIIISLYFFTAHYK